jgi:hypothetical protein
MRARFPVIRRLWSPMLAFALASTAGAQEPARSPGVDVHEQMRQLILRVEQGLRHVDGLLGNPDAKRPEGAESSIAARLAAARARSQKVLDDIDLLLEIRHHPHHGAGGT